jgi:hypothetical protein
MKPYSPHRKSSFHSGLFTTCCVSVCTLFLSLPSFGKVLDNFSDNIKSAWTDAANGGSIIEAGGVFTTTTTAAAGALTSSKKTSESFTTAAGHTIELRVNVDNINPGGGATNGHAVLGWVPSGALNSSGYGLSVSVGDVTITKAGVSLYTTNLATPIQSSNLVLVLRLTPAGASMNVKGSVYKKGAGNYTLLVEYTANDASGILGAGNAAIGAHNQPSGTAASVVFDDLQGFDIINSAFSSDFSAARLPEFNVASGVYATADGWVNYRPAPGSAIENTSTPGELNIISTDVPATYLTATYYNGQTFKISDGGRLEFQVDVTLGSDNNVILPIISYLPNGLPDLATLATYFIGQSDVLIAAGKSASTEWVPNSVIPLKNSNVRFVQNMTGEGTAVRLEQRIEDLDVPANDPARVLFQTAYLDSTASYINKNGYYCLVVYHDNTAAGGNSCRVDNALVNQTAPGNTPPIIGNISPGSGKNFLSATNKVTFTVADDVNTPLTNIVLTLNGVRYTNGSPGVSITPTGATSTLRTFTLSNLVANIYYNGNITATDNQNASSTVHYEFDTFDNTNLVVEVEDYNFSTNATTGGVWIDNPTLIAEPNVGPNSYNGVTGLQDIDFHDNRGGPGTYGDADHSYRSDNPRQYHTSDGPREKYTAAGGAGAGFYENQIAADNSNGDWMNYTRTFPMGTYNVYLRAATYNMVFSLATLEKVTSDPTITGQTTAVIGSFVQLGDIPGDTGYDVHRNVPLTDATGNPVVVRFAGGAETLRLNDVFTDSNSDIFQNYMVFINVPDPGVLRPIVALASPQPGSSARRSPQSEATYCRIANRDTTVNAGTVTLQINGVTISSAAVNPVSGGVEVAWSLTNLPPARVYTNTVTFDDSDGTNLTYSWTYSYQFLASSNALPVGALTARGFNHRTAQDDAADGDSLIRAEQQLATPPEIVSLRTWTTNVQTLNWSDDSGNPSYVPGLDGGDSGYATGPYNYIATEDLAYLHLKAGAYRFRVGSDDGFQLRSGQTPSDVTALILAQSDGNTFGGTFDFVVEAEGLYPIRNIWYEQEGGANFNLAAYDFASATYIIINDPADPSGVVKAYLANYDLSLHSSATLGGTYALDGTAVVDRNAKTVTVPITGGAMFYKLNGPSAVTITSVKVAGSNIVLTYQF